MEAVPRLVSLSLAVQLMVEIVLGPSLDTALHGGRPSRAGIGGEGAQAFPRVEGPSRRGRVPIIPARPAPLRVRGLDQPVERLADPAVVSVPEPDQRPGHVAGVAVVTMPVRHPADAASLQRGLVHPVLARCAHLGDSARRAEVRKREQVPVRRDVLRITGVSVADPPAARVAAAEDLRGPRGRRDPGLRVPDVGVGLALSEEPVQRKIPHRQLVRFDQPIEDLTARHRRSDGSRTNELFQTLLDGPAQQGGPYDDDLVRRDLLADFVLPIAASHPDDWDSPAKWPFGLSYSISKGPFVVSR